VLQDSATLEASGVKDGDFLVIMVAKAKAPEAAPAVHPNGGPYAETSVPAAASTGGGASAAPAPSPAAAAAAMMTGAAGGQAMEPTIQMLCDMGFPRTEVERCLRAAFGNPDRAVEYLMSGIPPNLMQQASGQPAPAPAAPPTNHPGAPAHPQAGLPYSVPQGPMMVPSAGGAASGPLAKLQNFHFFPRMKAVVQQNPGALNQVLSVLNQADPSLIPLIAEHQEEFVDLLSEPVVPGQGAGFAPNQGMMPPAPPSGMPSGLPGATPGAPLDPVAAMLAAAAAAGGGGGGGAAPAHAAANGAPAAPAVAANGAGGGVPSLSEAEQQAVGRLEALGFNRAAAVQAYLACDRNEELAANYLFEMADASHDAD